MPRQLLPLAKELNAMLGRLDEAFHRLNDFSSDIAPELRTPLGHLMTQTGVAVNCADGRTRFSIRLPRVSAFPVLPGVWLFRRQRLTVTAPLPPSPSLCQNTG